MHFDVLTIDILVEVEQVGFDATGDSVEGRAASNADGAGVLSALDKCAARINALRGNELIGGCEVGCRETDLATSTIAANDLGRD
jgi:hypothetical protein